MTNKINWQQQETEENPKMLEVYLDQAYQNALCFALACEEPKKDWKEPRLLLTVIAGSDSTLQAIKASIDTGLNGISFGHGIKGLTGYDFKSEFKLESDKESYEKFPMTINSNRKALAIVHDDLLGDGEYILSFDGDPAEEVRKVFGGGKYGLNILPEWKNVLFQELSERGHLEEMSLYFDSGIFPDGLKLFKLHLEEEAADSLVSELIKLGKMKFPKKGTGESLAEIDSLTDYMQGYSHDMVAKLSSEISPTHSPLEDQPYTAMEEYKRPLFPVQSHVATAVSKRLQEKKSVIIQGEMSTGKTAMMTAVADSTNRMKGKKGYFACVMVPPSLTKKWATEEIHFLLPNAKVYQIQNTNELIKIHRDWENNGRPKPKVPTFFVISFTTMRGDCSLEPSVNWQNKKTKKQSENNQMPYRYGYICPDCGNAHQVIENKSIHLNEKGEEEEKLTKRAMLRTEFGTTRRLHNTKNPANAFCSECGNSLWTKRVPTRYSSFSNWVKHEKKIVHAVRDGNQNLVKHLQSTQPELPKSVGKPRRLATIEYIRRQMKNFFDISIVDEVHELKGGMTAQGNSLGSLAAVSKKVVAGTGTLFGGKAEDVYYLLWRLFPTEMVKAGYKYSEVNKFNQEYGNIETTVYNQGDEGEYSNKQSRGGTKRTSKVVPGISPFVFGKFLVQNAVLVRLVDVWPDPVELVNVPTILVEMDEELKKAYEHMANEFENAIDSHSEGHKLYLPYTDSGIAYPDNPFTFPEFRLKTEDGAREHIWTPMYLDESKILPKEKKLQELVSTEISENRPSIIYIRDTGSTKSERDIQPRLEKILSQVEGAKVAVLRTGTTGTAERSDWLRKKVEKEGYNVIIVSTKLVKVGLDLLCTPTLIFYQFDWSLFTMNQASRRAWRIGQTEECRLFYLAYKDTFQESMAQLVAKKNKAAQALNGDVSTDGLNAMLGDDGDLQSMLIKSIKTGEKLKGSTEEWVASTSDRARELLQGIGKKKVLSIKEQFIEWTKKQINSDSTRNKLIANANLIISKVERSEVLGFKVQNGVLQIDLIEAFGIDMVADGSILAYLVDKPMKASVSNTFDSTIDIIEVKLEDTKRKKRSKATPIEGQLGFELFG
ncbi:helicase-related protein [Sutcliffiella cohnii]|uniref:helicase-related protein n=1 Tax=Sutcliffiella cohnii TaxID=33932 RepID=UPI00082B4893|nr:helicase-related protein [Sutcliffiella cohnii]